MSANHRWPSRCRLALLLLVGSAACAGPSALGTARTLDAGALDHVVGAELGFVDMCDGDQCAGGPFLGPSYAVRYGVLGFLEPGARFSVAEARLDLKTELLRSRFVDLALDPWVSGGPRYTRALDPSAVELRTGLQALVDLNLDDEISVVLSGGPAAGGGLTVPHVLTELSLGFDLRWFSTVRLHPEVGYRGLPWLPLGRFQSLTAGLGLGFGERPFFGSGPRPARVPSRTEREPWPEE